jgi:hypothetical protein
VSGIRRKMFDSAVAYVLNWTSNKGSKAFGQAKQPRYTLSSKKERITHALSFLDVFFKGMNFVVLTFYN